MKLLSQHLHLTGSTQASVQKHKSPIISHYNKILQKKNTRISLDISLFMHYWTSQCKYDNGQFAIFITSMINNITTPILWLITMLHFLVYCFLFYEYMEWSVSFVNIDWRQYVWISQFLIENPIETRKFFVKSVWRIYKLNLKGKLTLKWWCDLKPVF